MWWLLAIGVPALAADEVQGDLSKVNFGVVICSDAGRSSIEPTVRAAVIRAVAPAAAGKTVGLRFSECDGIAPDASCFAQSKAFLCREEAIVRILRAAAWAATKYELSGFSEYDAFRLEFPRWNVLAFQYADKAIKDSTVDDSHVRLRSAYHRYQLTEDSAAGSAFSSAEITFIALVDYLLATIVGHEIAHVNGELCPLLIESRSEKDGLIRSFLKLHNTGELFCRRAPSVTEVSADSCGLRHIHRVTDTFERRGANITLMNNSRRLAADLIGFALTFGWRPRENAPPGRYPFQNLTQYLYTPMRVLAFGAELRPSDASETAVCGEAASLFVHGTQELSKACQAGGGIVPDNVLALIPKSIETAWNGAKWTDKTVACKPR